MMALAPELPTAILFEVSVTLVSRKRKEDKKIKG